MCKDTQKVEDLMDKLQIEVDAVKYRNMILKIQKSELLQAAQKVIDINYVPSDVLIRIALNNLEQAIEKNK